MANEKPKNNDSIGRTFLVVFVLCLICSIVVAGSAVGLKAQQQEQKLLDKQRNILDVAGLLKTNMTTAEIKETYSSRIQPELLDLKTATLEKGDGKFDLKNALRSDETSMALPSEQDLARIHRRANMAEIYLVKDDQGKTTELVLPVYGSGLWSMMYAFISIDVDGVTSRGITYYSHGETPGLGGEVDNPQWRKQWVGKKLYNSQGVPAIKVVRGGAGDNPYGVDGLSGATLTSNGVQHMFDFWLGDNGFGPFLKKVREGALKDG
ncbi:Na(+)-translocating NADH-quinone reductase subunit C [Xenorhabdus bovienii]|uniref:Na(+)-translocating NADH-quinone reductase subunit C n=1 Tax=Xenorhabdus bovienii TaxID=40576 RepID=UPI0023B2D098|nr:Na(+)-translocating NADH-quinone reductase subunit C [Xenorhabdus bovienii]MDE9492929.1 Na(+)-translocating NADH-quinone reductase subunit C [Xenorhabdus bovienii]MDE9501367.1 Na(+)-translocating NADH-quinone reductase subunit C [Xenorhabdus bovienii]MDE9516495.1 Na(+)-translocating NADH-quinone reductase subunit C [Xenorhabdus bovienii]MDE9525093.1 Na(+)-translocating NADH-quinone reductase subunit C [Xenorhabdus bovienii]MDE9568997.1 Na(+)-translocating NADH-quinone reductase subunit C [X